MQPEERRPFAGKRTFILLVTTATSPRPRLVAASAAGFIEGIFQL
jgi:hypothetical protein